MIEKVYIYVLIDPRDNTVRYVGMSTNCDNRFKQHIKEVKGKKRNHRLNWVKGLLDENLLPILKIIEETSFEEKESREKYWIAYYGRENLVNGTDGGEGKIGAVVSDETKSYFSKLFSGEGNPFYGKHHSEETLQKLRNKFISDETKEKIRTWHTGKKLSDEHKKKISENSTRPFLGKHHTEESKEKNRQFHLGKPAWNKGKSTGKPSKYRGIKITGESSYVGVSIKGSGFSARVHVNEERLYLYGTSNEENTAIAYDIGAIFYYGIDSNLNFPELREKYISYLKQYEILDIKQLRKVIKNFINEEGSKLNGRK